MDTDTSLHRFIPLRKKDVLDLCLSDPSLSVEDATGLKHLATLLEALLHYEYHRRLERLKTCYAPFDPDADTAPLTELTEEERRQSQNLLAANLKELLNMANFEPITDADLRDALAEESLFKIRLEVDFNDFEEALFFYRGEKVRHETLVSLWGLRKRTIDFTSYSRVLVYLKFKDAAYFESRKRNNLNFLPGATMIKLFHNVPKADLEMLFPNSRVRMKTIDKLIIGVPAAVSGVVMLATKLGATLVLLGSLIAFWFGLSREPVEISQKHMVVLGAGLGGLAGFLFRQVGKFKNRKIRFMKVLTESLYFKNLDNNAGVLHHLIDAAEEEDFKEALLAYFSLLTTGRPMTREEIDAGVEKWLADRANCRIDFEIGDALDKLERFGIVASDGGFYRNHPLDEALVILDRTWDDFFGFNKPRA
ncbi:MAG: DUF3754 domain-containing protein [Deltaproteobacteria bacterium]|nr:DUF3754 domain-containing protein [Deltaproteobacteria bacterium]